MGEQLVVEGRPLLFLDTETTGLMPGEAQVWDLAWCLVTADGERVTGGGLCLPVPRLGPREWSMTVGHYFPPDMPAEFVADYKRRWDYEKARSLPVLMVELTNACAEASGEGGLAPFLVGMVPTFDQEMLRPTLTRVLGATAMPWHYHLVDVETLIAGSFGILPPTSSDELSRMIGVDPDRFERHTAWGDVLWAMALFEAWQDRMRR